MLCSWENVTTVIPESRVERGGGIVNDFTVVIILAKPWKMSKTLKIIFYAWKGIVLGSMLRWNKGCLKDNALIYYSYSYYFPNVIINK